jgi:hypothetical protein
MLEKMPAGTKVALDLIGEFQTDSDENGQKFGSRHESAERRILSWQKQADGRVNAMSSSEISL